MDSKLANSHLIFFFEKYLKILLKPLTWSIIHIPNMLVHTTCMYVYVHNRKTVKRTANNIFYDIQYRIIIPPLFICFARFLYLEKRKMFYLLFHSVLCIYFCLLSVKLGKFSLGAFLCLSLCYIIKVCVDSM